MTLQYHITLTIPHVTEQPNTFPFKVKRIQHKIILKIGPINWKPEINVENQISINID